LFVSTNIIHLFNITSIKQKKSEKLISLLILNRI
jgi:hypothetical protein